MQGFVQCGPFALKLKQSMLMQSLFCMHGSPNIPVPPPLEELELEEDDVELLVDVDVVVEELVEVDVEALEDVLVDVIEPVVLVMPPWPVAVVSAVEPPPLELPVLSLPQAISPKEMNVARIESSIFRMSCSPKRPPPALD